MVGAGALAAGVVSLALFSTGVAGAGAPDETGQTFAEAQAALTQAGFQAVMRTAMGDGLSQSDCIVTRQETTMGSAFQGGGTRGTVLNSSGKPKVLLSLDCSKKPKNSS